MRSFPWDSVATSIGEDGYPVYDRVYQASDLREVYETFFSNGIFTDSETALKVSPGEGMTVRVAPGRCCINGTVGYEEEERELALTASGTMDRIDTVVLRWDSALDARSIDLYVLAGAPSDTPVRPTLTRSETVWELGLCDVYITAHMLQTKAEKMTDTRLDSARCGVVAPFVRLDTSNFYDQLQAQTKIAVDLAQSAIDGTALAGKVSKAGDTMTGPLTLDVALAITSGGTGCKTNEEFRNLIRDTLYPVGCVYLSYNSTSPASLFGGSWTQITGRFLRMDNNVNTGGSDTHSHGAGGLMALINIRSRDKYLYEKGIAAAEWLPSYWGGAFSYVGNTNISVKHNEAVQVVGSTGSASNVPMYQNLYAWRRTA